MNTSVNHKKVNYKLIVAGFVLFLVIAFGFDFKPGSPNVTYMAAIAILMAFWWVTEAVPIAITSLLPIIFYPIMGIMNGKDISTAYINYVIFLFIGGFFMAIAMEEWNLHKRIALKILLLVGVSPLSILFGFMFASAFLSMWMSNTATAMLMLPIAISVSSELESIYGKKTIGSLNSGILMGIAYACSIGGIATLVGTPPNLSLVRVFNIIFPNGPEISFGEWFIFALPLSVFMFLFSLFTIYFIYRPKAKLQNIEKSFLEKQYADLGPVSSEQKRILVLFIILVFLWIFRKNIDIGNFTIPGWDRIFKEPKFINDGTIAIFMAALLFIVPSSKKGEALLNWESSKKIPWHIVLLFGGGFALAKGFVESGLSDHIGSLLTKTENASVFGIVAIFTSLMTGLTEFTSNTATTEMMLPIVAAIAVQLEINPILLMVPVTLAASMAFMFPIATPPNAIVFGSGRLTMKQMMKTGIILNVLAISIITIFTILWLTRVFDLDYGRFPDWAIPH